MHEVLRTPEIKSAINDFLPRDKQLRQAADLRCRPKSDPESEKILPYLYAHP